ncbi:hypothetical protein [Streptomyces albidoflavus]|nr:hypothetical protein [Streptomyces albidoflavus]
MSPARTRRDLERRHRRSFLAIAEERNITRAAARVMLRSSAMARKQRR